MNFAKQLYGQTEDSTLWEEIIYESDSIYLGDADTTFYISDTTVNSEYNRMGGGIASSDKIFINLSSNVFASNDGLNGVNVTGMFDKDAMPNDGSAEDQWDWMSEMAPKSIRFPSGANSPFMHLLTGDKGYGYDIQEIVGYFDASDGHMEYPDANAVAALPENTDATIFNSWTGNAERSARFNEFRLAYKKQDDLASGHLYIDDFIEMIKKIEDENEDHVVDVILCLNILTETATNCKLIVDYLRSSALNGMYNVNVVGVEMGNEVASKLYKDVMQFQTFDDYWNWLNGAEVTNQTTWEDAYHINQVLYMPESDHNYFGVFKTTPGFNCKVGLPADGLDDETLVYGLPTSSGSRAAEDWNMPLHQKDTSKFSAALGGKYKYDAVIFHNYYNAKVNEETEWWNHCAQDNLDNTYTCPEWSLTSYDTRLDEAYNCILENYKLFITDYNKDALDALNDIFHFEITSGKKKDLWLTEWNLNTKDADSKTNVYINGFAHAYVFQEWWMRNFKLNYTAGYRNFFFTYSTVQNFGSGSNLHLLTKADEPNGAGEGINELAFPEINKNFAPYNLDNDDVDKRNYYIRRATYWNMKMLSEISKNNLLYMKMSSSMHATNPNLPPTVFIKSGPTSAELFIFYSNITELDQNYKLLKGTITNLYPGSDILFEEATVHFISAEQPYSNSGKNTLYDINDCYTNVNPYEIEINGIVNADNLPACIGVSDNTCLTAPAYTIGYFKVPIIAIPAKLALSENMLLELYPNPSSDIINLIVKDQQIVRAQLLSTAGEILIEKTMEKSHQIDISDLESGHYLVVVTLLSGEKQFAQLIKSE